MALLAQRRCGSAARPLYRLTGPADARNWRRMLWLYVRAALIGADITIIVAAGWAAPPIALIITGLGVLVFLFRASDTDSVTSGVPEQSAVNRTERSLPVTVIDDEGERDALLVRKGHSLIYIVGAQHDEIDLDEVEKIEFEFETLSGRRVYRGQCVMRIVGKFRTTEFILPASLAAELQDSIRSLSLRPRTKDESRA